MLAQGRNEGRGQHRDAIPATLAVTNDDFAAIQGHVLDPEPQRFQKPQATTVEETRHQPRRALQRGKQRVDFGPAEHDRQPLRARRARDVLKPRQVDAQHLPAQK